MTLAGQVLVGLLAGLATGLFFGESAAPLAHVGRAFVLLLQMAVLPFVSVSLMAGLGALSPPRLAFVAPPRRQLPGADLGACRCWSWWRPPLPSRTGRRPPISAPPWWRSGRSSTSWGSTSRRIRSRLLADGVVPAVVVFSLAFGIALMGSDRKHALLETLLAAQDTLRRVTSAVVRLAPLGSSPSPPRPRAPWSRRGSPASRCTSSPTSCCRCCWRSGCCRRWSRPSRRFATARSWARPATRS